MGGVQHCIGWRMTARGLASPGALARVTRDHAVVQRDLLRTHFVHVAAAARAGLGRVEEAHDVEAAVALAARPLHRQEDVVLVVGRREVDERRKAAARSRCASTVY